jgi:hypothetical protein
MCRKINKRGCKYPEKLKGGPEKCSPEQIKECHDDISVKEHICAFYKKRVPG